MPWAKRKLGASVALAVLAVLTATASGCGGGDAQSPTAVTVADQSSPALAPPEQQATSETRATPAKRPTATGETTVPDPATPGSPPAAGAEQPTVSAPPTVRLDAPKNAYPLIWVRRGERVDVRTQPGGGTVAKRVGRRTDFGSPTVFGVVKQVDGWAGVSTP